MPHHRKGRRVDARIMEVCHMSYKPLLKRIAELRAAAKNKDCEWCREMGWGSCTQHCAPRAALHAPAHEMAACVEALVELLSKGSVDHQAVGADGNSGNRACPVCNADAALNALAKVML